MLNSYVSVPRGLEKVLYLCVQCSYSTILLFHWKLALKADNYTNGTILDAIFESEVRFEFWTFPWGILKCTNDGLKGWNSEYIDDLRRWIRIWGQI